MSRDDFRPPPITADGIMQALFRPKPDEDLRPQGPLHRLPEQLREALQAEGENSQ